MSKHDIDYGPTQSSWCKSCHSVRTFNLNGLCQTCNTHKALIDIRKNPDLHFRKGDTIIRNLNLQKDKLIDPITKQLKLDL